MPTDQGISHKPADNGGRPADAAPPCKTPLAAALKRSLDLVFSLIALACTLPILLLACAAIKLESPGAVLYRQWRSGRDGKPFQILKLRTMVDGADRLGPALTQSVDPRITRIGSVLRRWSIDELPQLLNVLAGQMSLVGPRPELVTIAARYTPRQRECFEHYLVLPDGLKSTAAMTFLSLQNSNWTWITRRTGQRCGT